MSLYKSKKKTSGFVKLEIGHYININKIKELKVLSPHIGQLITHDGVKYNLAPEVYVTLVRRYYLKHDPIEKFAYRYRDPRHPREVKL